MAKDVLAAPFVYFGGKSIVAADIWKRFGDTPNFVDPFMGSASVLFGRPGWHPNRKWTETISDIDGFIVNAYRAIQADPLEVAKFCDNPPFESDLHSRQYWLVNERSELSKKLEANPFYYDPEIAGFWIWGISSFIGGGFANGRGPWRAVDDMLIHLDKPENDGISRRIIHLGDNGRGVNRRTIHEGHFAELGIPPRLEDWMLSLANRLKRVRVLCGDWTRAVTNAVTTRHGVTSLIFDPPYTQRSTGGAIVYGVDGLGVEKGVQEYALENGDNPMFRIAVCGYEGAYEFPDTWETFAWKAHGGFSGIGEGIGKELATKERIWFSPHCLKVE